MPSEIEYLQSQIAEVERSLRLIEERKSEYTLKTDIPLDLIRNEEEKRDRLSDLRGRLEALSSATPHEKDTSRLSTQETIERIYVNRDEERRLFRQMVSSETSIHILLMEAEKGMGKTILLNQFWEISEPFKRARVDFNDPSLTIGRIFREFCEQYGNQSFPIFRLECGSLLTKLGEVVTHDAVIWAKIDAILHNMPAEEQGIQQRLITNAFLADLEAIHKQRIQPVVMLFDTFEKASSSTKAWIAGTLIQDIRRYPWIVCIIAGREAPRIVTDDTQDLSAITQWGLHYKLQPLSDQHAREYIEKVKIVQNEEAVTVITKLAKGNPYKLQEFARTLLGGS